MIRSLPFTPTVAFTAAAQPRREAVRPPDLVEDPNQDPFNRMLARQRDAARQVARQQGTSSTPAPAPVSVSQPAPAAEASSTPKTAAEKEADAASATNPSAPGAAVRTANRTALRLAEGKDRPAQIDPELPNADARHGRKQAGTEAEVLAKLFKSPPATLPPRLPPVEPEDPPVATGNEASELAPGGPGSTHHCPPLIECPVEPMTPLQMAAAAQAEDSTQGLQDRAAEAQTLAGGQAGTETASGGAAISQAAFEQMAAETTPAKAADAGDAAGAADSGPVVDSAPGGSAPGLPLTLSATPAGSTTASATPSARSATLEARPGTEAFAMKFSAQIAVWVREGVHEAQLQLNPADMGPVRVAILLNGAAAQVNFSAEHALTRQALEQALPTLAGSLAEAGFTLAGGGVFDQPQQSGRSGADVDRRNPAGGPGGVPEQHSEAQASVAVRPRGMVDLVA